LPLRVLGAGHSFSPLVVTGGVLVDLKTLGGEITVNPETGRVRVPGGTTLADLDEALDAAGRALPVLGDYDKQTIAGAVATATHGSSSTYGSLSSLVTAVRIATGTGEIVDIDEGDLRLLRAARVALGTLGVVLEVELRTVETFFLQEEAALENTGALVDAWGQNPSAARHFSFHWLPSADSADLLQLTLPGAEDGTGADVADGAAGADGSVGPEDSVAGRALVRRFREVPAVADADLVTTPNQRLDHAFRVFTGRRPKPFHEMEQFVPVQRSEEAFTALTELITTRFPEQQYPLEVRWVGTDDAYLSPTAGGERVALSIVVKPNSDYWDFLLAADQLLAGFDARPHWGKLHFLTRERVEQLYPAFDSFREVRRELDPDGVFLSDHTRALLG
jgi:FAD/FMN-containing dehydrogenase